MAKAQQAEGRLAWLWALLFPSRCIGCGKRETLLCDECRATIPWLPATVCPRCVGVSPRGTLCRRCAAPSAWQLASARAACRYDGLTRVAVHQLKYRQARVVAPLLAELVATALASRPLHADLVIAVPLSARRLRERGYNQSELIAHHLSRLVDLPPPAQGVLVRTRDTRPQVGLSANERLENMRGAFTCLDPTQVRGRRCLVVDDVSSTKQLHH